MVGISLLIKHINSDHSIANGTWMSQIANGCFQMAQFMDLACMARPLKTCVRCDRRSCKGGGLSQDVDLLFFSASHYCSIKTVVLATIFNFSAGHLMLEKRHTAVSLQFKPGCVWISLIVNSEDNTPSILF